jgi:hypothetical protein
MNDDMRSQLRRVIADYDEKLAEAERVEAAKVSAHEAFPARFASLRTGTIRPAIQEIVDILNECGHRASVHEQDESSSTVGGVKSAAISLRVVPKPFAQKAVEDNTSAVEVTFSASRSARKVAVSSTNTIVNNAGSIGKRGEYEIDAVTADVVANQVIQTLREAFGGIRGLRAENGLRGTT